MLSAPSRSSKTSGSVSPRSSMHLSRQAQAAAQLLAGLATNITTIKGGPSGHTGQVSCIAEVDDTVWTGGINGLVVIFDASEGTQLGVYHLPVIGGNTSTTTLSTGSKGAFDHVSSILQVWKPGFPKQGGETVWCGTSDGTIFIVDKTTGKAEKLLREHTDSVCCLEQSLAPQTGGGSKRHVVWSGSMDCTIRCWEAQTGEVLAKIAAHAKGVRCLVAVEDCLWSGSDDETIKIWEQRTKTMRAELQDHIGPVLALTFVPATQQVWSGSSDRTIICWDAHNNSGRQLKLIREHENRVTSLSTSKRFVWSGSDDQTIRVWNTENWKEYRKISRLPGRVWCLTVTSDGKRVWSSYGPNLDLWVGEGGSIDVPERTTTKASSSSTSRTNTLTVSGDLTNGTVDRRKRGTSTSRTRESSEFSLDKSINTFLGNKQIKKKDAILGHVEKSLEQNKEILAQVSKEKDDLSRMVRDMLDKFFGALPDGFEDGEQGDKQRMAQLEGFIQQVCLGRFSIHSFLLQSPYPLS